MKTEEMKWGMVIDLDLCIGCQACSVACKQANNIPFVSSDQARMERTIQWNQFISTEEDQFPHTKVRY